MEIGAEYEEQVKGFKELSMVLIVSVTAIYLALLFQFKNAVKPLMRQSLTACRARSECFTSHLHPSGSWRFRESCV
jgi:hypothetical protein